MAPTAGEDGVPQKPACFNLPFDENKPTRNLNILRHGFFVVLSRYETPQSGLEAYTIWMYFLNEVKRHPWALLQLPTQDFLEALDEVLVWAVHQIQVKSLERKPIEEREFRFFYDRLEENGRAIYLEEVEFTYDNYLPFKSKPSSKRQNRKRTREEPDGVSAQQEDQNQQTASIDQVQPRRLTPAVNTSKEYEYLNNVLNTTKAVIESWPIAVRRAVSLGNEFVNKLAQLPEGSKFARHPVLHFTDTTLSHLEFLIDERHDFLTEPPLFIFGRREGTELSNRFKVFTSLPFRSTIQPSKENRLIHIPRLAYSSGSTMATFGCLILCLSDITSEANFAALFRMFFRAASELGHKVLRIDFTDITGNWVEHRDTIASALSLVMQESEFHGRFKSVGILTSWPEANERAVIEHGLCGIVM